MSALPVDPAAPASVPSHPPLSISAELSAYYTALILTQPSLSSVLISASPTVGRFLCSASAVLPSPSSSPIFHEAAALCASEDPSVCLSCHRRHEGVAELCLSSSRHRQLRGALRSIVAAASAAGYGESRGLMVADWIIRVEDSKALERTQRLSRAEDSAASPISLAQSFARPPPSPPSFALPTEGRRGKTQPQPLCPSSPPNSQADEATSAAVSPSPPSPSSAVCGSVASLPSLALSAIFSLDAGPPSLLSVHSAFASELWHSLPLPLRRLISVSSLTQLLCILELNSHELIDEGGGRGESLFPFFALIQHSCRENCAFTALAQPHPLQEPTAVSSPSVSVTCLRPISPGSALSINYAPPYLPTSVRREYLSSNYHFHCTCPLCEGELPDRCRAFICGGCGGVVWVWGEGKLEDGLRGWRCSEPACTAEVTEAQVNQWREAEAYLEGEVQRIIGQAEEAEYTVAADEHSDQLNEKEGKKKQEKAGEEQAQRREHLKRLQFLLQRYLLPSSHTGDVDRSTAPIAGEAEAETEDGREAIAESEGTVVDASATPAPHLSKSQLRNRRRRTKQRRLLSVVHPSHFHIHTLLDLFCQAQAEAGQWNAAVQAAEMRLANVKLLNEGEVHWMEAVEWSALATLYREVGDETARKAAAAQCYAINRACFGEAAASTRHALSQL